MSHVHAGRELFLEEMRELGVDVSRETRDRLEALVLTLGRWQKAINLVGR
ncbi:MAG: 16S rRNA (guanine(527)-N(7))-methyltransferase RsmG, partial [Proteobacteria bacterium]|nr:16S rRNA (guanine(527)-N(7))-methyltransferase RsmG [Pseudomonadota bacterium]